MKKLICGIGVLLLASTALFAADAPYGHIVPKAPPRAAGTYNWTGFYLGGNVGYGRGNHSLTNANTGGFASLFPTDPNSTASGIYYGAQGGYRHQLHPNFVLGAEVDFDWTRQRANTAQSASLGGFTAGTTSSHNLDWVWSARGIVGLVPPGMPNVLAYFTGGYAQGKVNIENASTLSPGCAVGCGSASNSTTRDGYVLGGGLEVAFARNWSLRGEYLHYSLGDTSTSYRGTGGGAAPTFNSTARFTSDVVRAGVNYRF